MVNFQSVIALSPESRSSPCVKQVDQHNLVLDDISNNTSAATTTRFPAEAVLSTTFDLGEAIIQPLVEDCIMNGSTTSLVLFAPESDADLPSSAFASLSSMLSSIPRRISEIEDQYKQSLGIDNNNNNNQQSSNCEVKIVALGNDGLPQDAATGAPATFFSHVTPLPRDQAWSSWLQTQWLAEHQDLERAHNEDYNHHRRTSPQPKLSPVILETETENFSLSRSSSSSISNGQKRGKLVTVVIPIPSNEFYATMLAIQSTTTASVLSALSSAAASSRNQHSQSSSSFPPPTTKPMSTFILDHLRHLFASPSFSNCVLLSVPDLTSVSNSNNNFPQQHPSLSDEARLLLHGTSALNGGAELLSSTRITMRSNNNNNSHGDDREGSTGRNNNNNNPVSPVPQNPVFSDQQPAIYRSTLVFGDRVNNNNNNSSSEEREGGILGGGGGSGFSLQRIGSKSTERSRYEEQEQEQQKRHQQQNMFKSATTTHESDHQRPTAPAIIDEETRRRQEILNQKPTKTIKIGLSEYPMEMANLNNSSSANNNSDNQQQQQQQHSSSLAFVSPSSRDDNSTHHDTSNHSSSSSTSTSNDQDERERTMKYVSNNNSAPSTADPSPRRFNKNDNQQQQQQQTKRYQDAVYGIGLSSAPNNNNQQQEDLSFKKNSLAVSRGLELLNKRRQQKEDMTTTNTTTVSERGSSIGTRSDRNTINSENVTNLEHLEAFVSNKKNPNNSSAMLIMNQSNHSHSHSLSNHQQQHHNESSEDYHQRIARFAALEAELKTVRSERDDLGNLLRKMSVRLTRAQKTASEKSQEALEASQKLAQLEVDFDETKRSLAEAFETLKREELTSTRLLRKHAIERVEAKVRNPSPHGRNNMKNSSSLPPTPSKNNNNKTNHRRGNSNSNDNSVASRRSGASATQHDDGSAADTIQQLTQTNERLREMLMNERDENEVLKAALISSMDQQQHHLLNPNGSSSFFGDSSGNSSNNHPPSVFENAANSLLRGLEIVSSRYGVQSLAAPERMSSSVDAKTGKLSSADHHYYNSSLLSSNIHPADMSLQDELAHHRKMTTLSMMNNSNSHDGSNNIPGEDLTIRALRKLKSAVEKLKREYYDKKTGEKKGVMRSGEASFVVPRVAASESDVNSIKIALTNEQAKLRLLDDLMLPFGALLRQSLMIEEEEENNIHKNGEEDQRRQRTNEEENSKMKPNSPYKKSSSKSTNSAAAAKKVPLSSHKPSPRKNSVGGMSNSNSNGQRR